MKPEEKGEGTPFVDGAYLFMPADKHAKAYSTIQSDVTYEQGKNIEQWTIKF